MYLIKAFLKSVNYIIICLNEVINKLELLSQTDRRIEAYMGFLHKLIDGRVVTT